jgi:hypothetical protein
MKFRQAGQEGGIGEDPLGLNFSDFIKDGPEKP